MIHARHLQARAAISARGVAATAALGLALAAPAFAQAPSAGLNQSAWAQVGVFGASIQSKARLDPSAGQAGTDLDLENELGLKKRRTVGSLLLGARFGGAWRAEFEHYALKRSGAQTLQGDVVWGDTVYPASATVASELDSKVYRLGLGYSFHRTPDAEAGAVVGLHVTDFQVAIEGNGQVNGTPVALRREEKQETVPLPTVGLYGTWALSPSWLVAARGDLLWLKLRGYKGELLNLSLSGIYRFTPNVGLGAGLRYVDYTLDGTRDGYRGRLEYRFAGPQVFLDIGF